MPSPAQPLLPHLPGESVPPLLSFRARFVYQEVLPQAFPGRCTQPAQCAFDAPRCPITALFMETATCFGAVSGSPGEEGRLFFIDGKAPILSGRYRVRRRQDDGRAPVSALSSRPTLPVGSGPGSPAAPRALYFTAASFRT